MNEEIMETETIFIKEEPIDWEIDGKSAEEYDIPNSHFSNAYMECDSHEQSFDAFEIKEEPTVADDSDVDTAEGHAWDTFQYLKNENISGVSKNLETDLQYVKVQRRTKSRDAVGNKRMMKILQAVQNIVREKTDRFMDLKRNRIQICSDCGYIGSSTHEMLSHIFRKEQIRRGRQSRLLECLACGLITKDDSLFLRHRHVGASASVCRHCGVDCGPDVKRHELRCGSGQIVPVDSEIAHRPRNRLCQRCGLEFSSPQECYSHICKSSSNKTSVSPASQQFRCAICNETMSTALAFSRHLSDCQIPESVQCAHCGQSFVNKTVIARHLELCERRNNSSHYTSARTRPVKISLLRKQVRNCVETDTKKQAEGMPQNFVQTSVVSEDEPSLENKFNIFSSHPGLNVQTDNFGNCIKLLHDTTLIDSSVTFVKIEPELYESIASVPVELDHSYSEINQTEFLQGKNAPFVMEYESLLKSDSNMISSVCHIDENTIETEQSSTEIHCSDEILPSRGNHFVICSVKEGNVTNSVAQEFPSEAISNNMMILESNKWQKIVKIPSVTTDKTACFNLVFSEQQNQSNEIRVIGLTDKSKYSLSENDISFRGETEVCEAVQNIPKEVGVVETSINSGLHLDSLDTITCFQCPDCSKKFTSNAALIKHTKICKLQCALCGDTFTDATLLQQHVGSHLTM